MPWTRFLILASLAACFGLGLAWADDDDHSRKRKRYRDRRQYSEHQVPPAGNPLYRDTCGACHFLFQPALLPAGSWRRILAQPDNHFGEQLSLSPEDQRAIAQYLEANAAENAGSKIARKILSSLRGSTPLRITEVPYIQHKHADHDIPRGAFARKSVGSRANCIACHTTADQGIYDEHQVRIPR
jgi:Dihaem cytochrome c